MGWLELGNPAEAQAELAQLSQAAQGHPDALEVQWLVCADQQRWTDGLQVARTLVRNAPERCPGWLHLAYALRRVPEGGLKSAWEALLPAFERFPAELLIPYNLSCYACQMGQLEVARVWFRRALDIGGKEQVRPMALADPDLKPLWEEIGQL